ncbi:MAG: protein kinase [Bryobacteraceae bacterium]
MVGSSIAHYRITSKLGEGGMGVVYRAVDTKLDREVAIKVLPADVAQEPDRLARFEREARTLASLNHPNIAAIYGVEDAALVMELIEGPTLADRMQAGALPIDEAIAVARQIADALEAAHEKAIVHRDLKPANVKITPDGTVKLLDFGLAKAMESTRQVALDPVNSPTVVNVSIPGVIMGTAAYMAPEQAKGQPVDKRADIWAFGVVLWEMLTGSQLFDSGTVAEAIAGVLRADIDLNKLPAGTPSTVRALITRCLDRNVKTRLRDIGEARILLSEPQSFDPPAPAKLQPPPTRRNYLPWALAALFAAGIPAAWLLKPKPDLPVIQFELPPPENAKENSSFGLLALSPDGGSIVFRGTGNEDHKQMLWLRRLSGSTWKVLEGTENGTRPFWSPDSRTIGFFADGKMKRIDAEGGAVHVICDADPASVSWNRRDELFFQQAGKPFLKVNAAGGRPEPALPGDTIRRNSTEFKLLPDGQHFLYDSREKEPGIHIASLKDPNFDRVLISGPDFRAQLVEFVPNPHGGGWIVWDAGSQILAGELDLRSMRLSTTPTLLARSGLSTGLWAVSASGLLAYSHSRVAPRHLNWVSRTGTVLEQMGKPGRIASPSILPGGKSVLFVDGRQLLKWDPISASTAAVTNASIEVASFLPSPDGKTLFYRSVSPRSIHLRPMDSAGGGRSLYPGGARPTGLSNDGRWLLVSDLKAGKYQLVMVPIHGGPPVSILREAVQPTSARLSPDGRWIVYSALVQGKREIFVSALPKETGGLASESGTWQLSRDGGDQPLWRGDGKEIVYIGNGGQMTAVPVTTEGNQVHAGTPVTLFFTQPNLRGYDMTPDGSRFLMPLIVPGEQDETSIGFIYNWPKLMDRKSRAVEIE